MLKCRIEDAVYGMLHYYGVMSVTDIFILSQRCGLCSFRDYAFFRKRIQTELIDRQQIYVYKEFLCHKWVRNPAMIIDLQKEKVAADYKEFPLQAYLTAGRNEMIWSEPFTHLRDFLEENATVPTAILQNAFMHLWQELSNMSGLVPLTTQCIQQLQLPWQPENKEYMRVLETLRSVAVQMPQWYCKGYSPAELAEMEEKVC